MTDAELEFLKTKIHVAILIINELQSKHIKETGRPYVISGPLKQKEEVEDGN